MFLNRKLLSYFFTGWLIGGSRLVAADPYDQSSVPLEVTSADSKLARIVLLAGSPSNKSGQHEYFAGCALFMDWLRQTPGVDPVLVRDGWPKNEKILEGARAVVCYMDGGGKQPFLEPARMKKMQALVDAGAGLAMLHQAVDYPTNVADKVQSWLGGVWLPDIGCRGHWDMEFSGFPNHPIMRGVKPFAAPGDGWLYNLHFVSNMKGVTPLLKGAVPDKSRTTADAKTHKGREEIIAWAYERPDGGRSFSFTGADLHKQWANESQRRLMINGILWTAKISILEGGAPVEFKPESLNKNLDDKPAATLAPKRKASPAK